MKLVVNGKPYIGNRACAVDRILVAYDPRNKTTMIDCDIDVVTLGFAAQTLLKVFDEYVDALEPAIAAHLRRTIMEVVHNATN